MDDLVTWLRAQLDDDEQVARTVNADDPTGDCWFDCIGGGHGDHHLRWSPERVVAEVDAKRRILDVYRADVIDVSVIPGRPEWVHGATPVEAHTVLRLLALPYADRPGYREEWRP